MAVVRCFRRLPPFPFLSSFRFLLESRSDLESCCVVRSASCSSDDQRITLCEKRHNAPAGALISAVSAVFDSSLLFFCSPSPKFFAASRGWARMHVKVRFDLIFYRVQKSEGKPQHAILF